MIEIICDETEQGTPAAEVPIRLPKNIRQIGEGTNDTKIYIEDYVITYIRKFWEKDKESIGILLGEVKHSGKETYIFVPGAIKAEGAMKEGENRIEFDDDAWGEIYATIKQHFNRYMIVGWFLNTRTSCNEPNAQLMKLHIDNFPGTDKILFLSDMTEKEEAIYRMENGVLTNQKVYYAYYERNNDMQEYMMAEKEGSAPVLIDEGLKDTVPENYRAILRERKEASSEKRVIGMLYGACTFLAVVILMIGVAMMNNYDKIAGLEQLVSDLYQTAMGMAEQSTLVNENKTVVENVTGNIMLPNKKEKETTTEKSSTGESSTGESSTGEISTGESSTDGITTKSTSINETSVLKQEETSVDERETAPDNDTETIKDVDVVEKADFYVVREGDTLTSISRKFYNTDKMVEAIKAFNQIENGDYIYSGQIIGLP